ncbi:hypothetical protein [Devosia sp. Root105]|uniref:hypothetical protein n=1 Tax=Devosia sp. Root105 TaxID=1736423 RepID=UPI000B22FCC7|nr:hypothetical protein [Devosia sp. Root105]
MPTGYTAGVADGTVTDLRTFALTCARGMGALIMMRDEPMDAPLPERFEPSEYSRKELDKAIERLKELKAMSPEQLAAGAAAWNAENDTFKLKQVRENQERRERYDRLIAEAEAWQGAPEGLKGFMLDQLRQSRDFDTSDEPLKHCEPTRSPVEWWAEECRKAAWNVEYHSKQDADERRRTDERNAWLAQLRASLPPATEVEGA